MTVANTGVPSVQAYVANSIYDPDDTGTGHQPLGHDTWATLYNHYTVVGSKMSLRVVAASVDNYLAPVVVGIKLCDDNTPSTTINAMLEQGLTTHRMVNCQAGSLPVRLSKGFSARKFFHVKDTKDNDRLGALFGANPSEKAFFVIMCGTSGGVAIQNAKTVFVEVTIDYIVSLAEPKDLAQS